MTVQHWIILWKTVLIGGISLFAVLAVVVAIGGLFDIRRLFRQLHEQHHERDAEGQPASDKAATTGK